MPMESSALLRTCNLVAYVYSDDIAPVSLDRWSRECTIDEESASIHSIGSDDTASDVEIVRGTPAACRDCQYINPLDNAAMLHTTVEICGIWIGVVDGIASPSGNTPHPNG